MIHGYCRRAVWWMRTMLVLVGVTLAALLAYSPAPVGQVSAAASAVNPALLVPWLVTTVDTVGDAGRFASLAIHPTTGRPHIAYYKATSGTIQTAHLTPGAGNCVPNTDWDCTNTGFVPAGSFPSLAIAPSGACTIAYQAQDRMSNAMTSYSVCFGGNTDYYLRNFVTTGATGLYNSLKFDANGTWHMAFQTITTTGYLEYAAPTESQSNCIYARCDVIESGAGVGAGASLDLNFGGVPRIAYRGAGGHLSYARYISPTVGNCGPSKTWQCDMIDASAVVSHSIALYAPKCLICSANDTTRIAYYDVSRGNLKLAALQGGGNCGPSNTWQCDVIDSVGSLNVPAVSLAAVGDTPIIAYHDNNFTTLFAGRLKIARPASALGLTFGNCGPENPFATWQCDAIDDGGVNIDDVGGYPSLGVDPKGLAYIAYYDATDGKLKVAYQRFQTFVPLVLR